MTPPVEPAASRNSCWVILTRTRTPTHPLPRACPFSLVLPVRCWPPPDCAHAVWNGVQGLGSAGQAWQDSCQVFGEFKLRFVPKHEWFPPTIRHELYNLRIGRRLFAHRPEMLSTDAPAPMTDISMTGVRGLLVCLRHNQLSVYPSGPVGPESTNRPGANSLADHEQNESVQNRCCAGRPAGSKPSP